MLEAIRDNSIHVPHKIWWQLLMVARARNESKDAMDSNASVDSIATELLRAKLGEIAPDLDGFYLQRKTVEDAAVKKLRAMES